MKEKQQYMARCLQLAKLGLGRTYPNPLVGSVIVRDNKIIGEGWHQRAGGPHAEVHAIQSVSDKSLLKDATLYVNLEPCSHYGKTPPCADLIIASGIKTVVIGNLDPNPQVAGRGVKKLLEAGCKVRTGVLEEACSELNKRFFSFHLKKRPYVILKWAQSQDGFLAPEEKTRTAVAPVWITNLYSRQWVHKLRNEEMAILVGTHTVEKDNPSLTTRDWAGTHPIRIVIDRNLRLNANAAIFNQDAPTYVITEAEKSKASHLQINFSKPVAAQILKHLYEKDIQSVIIEGGKRTLETFINEGIWDEALIFTGPIRFNAGVPAPQIQGHLITTQYIKEDCLSILRNTHLP